LRNSENLDGGTTEYFFSKLLFDLFAALHAVDPEKQEDDMSATFNVIYLPSNFGSKQEKKNVFASDQIDKMLTGGVTLTDNIFSLRR